MNGRLGLLGGTLVLGGAVLLFAGTLVDGGLGPRGMMGAITAGETGAMMGRSWTGAGGARGGMMGRGGTFGGGMMGAYGSTGSTAPGPGETGFVAGTAAAPRVIRVLAGPGYAFSPSTIVVARGETVTFAVTSMGGLTHEFMVGPAADVAADTAGTPEIADIGMMETKSITYTFDGAGPYAFACHAAGHYEAGMKGTITVAG